MTNFNENEFLYLKAMKSDVPAIVDLREQLLTLTRICHADHLSKAREDFDKKIEKTLRELNYKKSNTSVYIMAWVIIWILLFLGFLFSVDYICYKEEPTIMDYAIFTTISIGLIVTTYKGIKDYN